MKNNLWVCKNRTGFWVVTESLAEAVSFRKENIVKSSISNEYLSQVTATNKKIFNSENEDGRINFKYFYEYAWACKDKLFIVGRGKGGFYTYVLNDKCEIISYQKILEEDLYPVDVEYYESENAYRVIILAEDFFSTNGRLIRLSFNKFEEGDVNEVKKTE